MPTWPASDIFSPLWRRGREGDAFVDSIAVGTSFTVRGRAFAGEAVELLDFVAGPGLAVAFEAFGHLILLVSAKLDLCRHAPGLACSIDVAPLQSGC